MATLTIKIKAVKPVLVISSFSLKFKRGTLQTKTAAVPYTGGSGQALTAGQVLYTAGQAGQAGYLVVKSLYSAVLSGSGEITLSVEHHPAGTAANQTTPVTILGKTADMSLSYSSNPVVQDLAISLENRAVKTFGIADFSSKYSDYDSDLLSEVTIMGDVSGWQLSNAPYTEGAWIPIGSIANLKYVSRDANDAYNVTNTWKAKDSSGDVSNVATVQINVSENVLPVAVDVLCNESRFYRFYKDDVNAGIYPSFKIKGKGKFFMGLISEYNTIADFFVFNKTTGQRVDFAYANYVGYGMIQKPEAQDCVYELQPYKFTNNPRSFSFAISCAAAEDEGLKILFPNKLFFYRASNGVITNVSFPIMIFNRLVSGYVFDYSFRFPPNNIINTEITRSSSAGAVRDGQNHSWVQELISQKNSVFAPVGTVQDGYSVLLTFEGVVYTFNFSVEIIKDPFNP